MTANPPRRGLRQRGFSLIELMVAVGIGLVITLAVTTVLLTSENAKRTIGSLNDTGQNGAYASYILDRTLRSAGSGFTRAGLNAGGLAMGCLIGAARSGTTVLPAATLPAPFTAMAGRPIRLAPVIIHSGASANGSDAIVVMNGAAGQGEAPFLIDTASATQLALPNTLTLRANDLVLLTADTGSCLLEQVAATFNNVATLDTPLTLGGTYYQATINGSTVSDYSNAAGRMFVLGNGAASQPRLQVIGVDAANTLVAHDLLQLDGTNVPVPITDGVLTMRALYGVDTNSNGILDSWVTPTDGTNWGQDRLLDGSMGTSSAQDRIGQIVAIRIALVLQTSLVEKTQVAPASVSLFSDMGAGNAVTVPISNRYRQVRVVEATVPLRNFLLP